jgi:hypothetical protein
MTDDALLTVADWDDVLARSRRHAARPRLVAAAALASVALVATPALALHGGLSSFFDLARSPARPGTWLLVGPRVEPDAQLRAAARLTHVRAGSLRLVGAAGSGFRRVSLVAGIGPDGRPWLAQQGSGWTNDFFPLFGTVADPGLGVWHARTLHGCDGWHFPTYGRADEHRQVFAYVAFGRAAQAATDWATVVGFERPDVARVDVVTASGATRPAGLARGGGFGYAARAPGALPRTLRAYDDRGRLIQVVGLHTAPLAS